MPQVALRLVRNMLTTGYLEDWVWHETLSGAPQGGVASPVMSNIYLHRLDHFVETVLIPEYTRGKLRARNPAYRKVEQEIARGRRRGDRAKVRSLYRRLHSLPSRDLVDRCWAGRAAACAASGPRLDRRDRGHG